MRRDNETGVQRIVGFVNIFYPRQGGREVETLEQAGTFRGQALVMPHPNSGGRGRSLALMCGSKGPPLF